MLTNFMARREKWFRQTYPGPNSADNQLMLQNIRSTLENHHSEKQTGSGMGSGTGAERLERSDSKERTQMRRSSPPSELTSSGSPSSTPRMAQQSRSTPTKQLASRRTKHAKRELATIRRDLKQFASDPGFHAARDKVNKRMLDELISLGYNEVAS